MDLSGQWRAAPADDELRRVVPTDEFDDDGWEPIAVPGHWRSVPAFSANDDPLFYRRRFEIAAPGEGRRAWLAFDGTFYQSDVWLDGTYLGDTEGYFVPHEFEVTEHLRSRTEHALAVEVSCAPQRNRKAKRNLTGVFQHGDFVDPEWNPGGIWRPVGIVETGPVRIERLRLVCLEATPERAVVAMRAVLDADVARSVRIETVIGATDHALDQPLAAGPNRVEWRLTVSNPRLWWPRTMGDPAMTDAAIRVLDPETGAVSDERVLRTGLRQVREKQWTFDINGERLFLKGANYGPTRMAIGATTTREVRADLDSARSAGLDFLRVHAHIGHPDLYTAADETGMLLWQDLPLQWGYARSVGTQAVRQAREAVDLLGHHPSIFHWCAHDEPIALDGDAGDERGPTRAPAAVGIRTALQGLPSWNKSVLDLRLHRTLRRSDRSRSVSAHSGILPGVASAGSDTHLYFGWYRGSERDLPLWLGRFPRLGRFVSEFGAQAVPASHEVELLADADEWPDLAWDELAARHGLQRAVMDRYVGDPSTFASFGEWRDATQQYQADLLRRQVEELRRRKYHPTGGFAMFSFADPRDHPAITWSVLGHDRVPKLGFRALADACAPVIVTADRPPAVLRAGDAVALDVHVVSDRRDPLSGAIVRARWSGGGEERTWRWTGDIAADACTRVGMVEALIGPVADGTTYALELVLEHAEAAAANRYDAVVRT